MFVLSVIRATYRPMCLYLAVKGGIAVADPLSPCRPTPRRVASVTPAHSALVRVRLRPTAPRVITVPQSGSLPPRRSAIRVIYQPCRFHTIDEIYFSCLQESQFIVNLLTLDRVFFFQKMMRWIDIEIQKNLLQIK